MSSTNSADDAAAEPGPAKPPSAVPGIVLLGVTAAMIVIVLIKPDMPSWLRVTVSVISVVLVIVLLGYAFRLFRSATRGPRR